MVVRDGLSLLDREGAKRGPQVVIGWCPALGGGSTFCNCGNRHSAATLRTQHINRLVVRNSDQPSLDIGAIGEVWISPQGGKEGLRPSIVGIRLSKHGAAHPEHGWSVLGDDLFKRPFHPHQPCRRWHGAKREVTVVLEKRAYSTNWLTTSEDVT
jgi:hypothetical protein